MKVEIGKYILMDPEICHGKPVFKGPGLWSSRFWKCSDWVIKKGEFLSNSLLLPESISKKL